MQNLDGQSDLDDEAPERGFALVELLVAMAILALCLNVAFGVLSNVARTFARAQKLTEATLVAQSLLDRAGTEIWLKDGERHGETATGLHWKLIVAPFGSPEDQKAWPVSAYVVAAEVSSDDGTTSKPVILKTLRFGLEAAR